MKIHVVIAVVLMSAFLSAEGRTTSRKKRSTIEIPKLPRSMQQTQSQSQTQTQTQTETVSCDPPCSENGACVDVNTCNCDDGWTGLTCHQFECVDDCVHGVCAGPNVCSCNEGWEGDLCDMAICTPECGHNGICDGPNHCECSEHWSGDLCDVPTCGDGCENGGTCSGPNTCECPNGYRGTRCQTPLPRDCVFPFEYNGKLYEECTNDHNAAEFWCSKTVIYQGEYEICNAYPVIEASGGELPAVLPIPAPTIESSGQGLPIIEPNPANIIESSGQEASLPGFEIEGSTAGLPGIEASGAEIPGIEASGTGLPGIEASGTGIPEMSGHGEGSGGSGGEGVAMHGSTCAIWNSDHYLTFDGALFSSAGRCHYEIISDCSGGNSFVISVFFVEGKTVLRISNTDMELELTQGVATFNGEKVSIPSLTNGVHIESIPYTDFIVLYGQLFGLSLKWDGDSSFFFHISDKEKWAGKLCGVCGNFNGNMLDDMIPKGSDDITVNMEELMDSWQIKDQADVCTTPEVTHYCSGLKSQQIEDAASVCEQLKQEDAFAACAGYVAESTFNELCLMAMCQCTTDYTDCICDSLAQFSRLCVARGAKIDNWRTEQYCAKECTGGMVYMECGTPCPKTCRNRLQQMVCPTACVDGCFCPSGTVLDGSTCVPENECSCLHNGTSYKNGEVRREECRECTCQDGSWSCDLLPCGGECAVTGDPHYRTFDGKTYNFDGKCQYVLATDGCGGSNYTFLVTAENVQCGESGYCTKSVLLVTKGMLGKHKYKLSQGEVVAVDDVSVSLPYRHGDISVERLSTLAMRLRSSLGFDLEWDGKMRVYIRLGSEWRNKVCGLCGNFNAKSTDDWTTPQGSVVTSVTTFGNSWKINQECADALPVLPDSCKISKELESYSEAMCSVIKGKAFSACHSVVDWNLFYYNCRNDVCRCGTVESCACDAVADYARECSRKGVIVQWRNETYCSVSCPAEMEYSECNTLCDTTCRAFGDNPMLCDSCNAGCFCPEGTYLTEDQTCVPLDKCECTYLGEIHKAGAKLDLNTLSCTCENGHMVCHNKTQGYSCDPSFEYFDCRTAPVGATGLACKSTCLNPFNNLCNAETEQCISGCTCPVGSVLDEQTHVCVEQEKCTCFHSGKVYMPGDERKELCNTCTCSSGGWQCTELACSAECSAIGDPHYNTFDGLSYDYQGACGYTLVQDLCNGKLFGTFRVVVENIPCGNTAVTCTKSVTVYFFHIAIHLTKGEGEPIVSYANITNSGLQATPKSFTYHVRKGSIYYIVETNIGISVLWNHDNAVKVQLSPAYSGQVCGLCGNFDYDQSNDFQTSDGDIVADPNAFGNSWKLIETCPDSVVEPHPCSVYPHRAPWAQKKCGIILSDTFQACHGVVDPTPYYDNCLYDTCGCDFGGDCECLCTAVGSYAQACAQSDVCVSWRDDNFCPVMCEAFDPGYGSSSGDYECQWKYEACGNPCPRTCWNKDPTFCPWQKLEGCYVQCKDDEVWDYAHQICKHESECPVIPPPPTTTTPAPTTTPEPTTTTPTPSPKFCHCLDSAGEIHLPGETWPFRGDESLCMTMECVQESPTLCVPVPHDHKKTCDSQDKPVCANYFPPVAVDDGCSCHWECQCYCFGQGDPHFFTFDGFYYPFQGNCTFILARSRSSSLTKEIKHVAERDYEIWMQNVQCEEAPKTTCTRMITILYNGTTVQLIDDYTVAINGNPPFDALPNLPANVNGIYIELRGATLFQVTIASIDLVLTYTGEDYSWGLKLPYGYAEDNTEGLCGVCNNNQEDELTTRPGVIVSPEEIEKFGYSWLVTERTESCYEPPPHCPDPPAPECDIILSDVFQACHPLVDPVVFHKICQFDTKCGKYSYCEALYGYARICQVEGACIDWRGADRCPLVCPTGLVYEACRPGCDSTCAEYNQGVQCAEEDVVEGCFCPPDTVNTNGVCEPLSNCTNCIDDNDNIIELGESIIPPGESCTICTCMPGQEFACNSLTCPAGWSPEIPDCGSCKVVQQVAGSDPCCPVYECVCNYESDKGSEGCNVIEMPTCLEPGYIPVRVDSGECIPEYDCKCNTVSKPCPSPPTCDHNKYLHTIAGDCCPTYECICKTCPHDGVHCSVCEDKVVSKDDCGCESTSCNIKGVCHHNGTSYEPEDEFWMDPCQHCTCHVSEPNERGCYHADCYLMACSSYCPPCHELITKPGECCGSCVKTSCSVAGAEGNTECVENGAGWEDKEKCEKNMCVADDKGEPVIITNAIDCPPFATPMCGPCYTLEVVTENCCPTARCVKSNVCCSLDGTTVKQPDESWPVDLCTTCTCTGTVNQTSGFNIVNCEKKPCQDFDESLCEGNIVPTEDGCCNKCDNKCIDANGDTYDQNETFYPDSCTVCSCVAGNEIKCNPITCKSSNGGKIPDCGSCHVAVRIADSDPCCPEYECTCNYELGKGDSESCPAVEVPTCEVGFAPILTNPDDCIPIYVCTCSPEKNPCPKPPTCTSLQHLVTDDSGCCPKYTCVCNKCSEVKETCSPCENKLVVVDDCACRQVQCTPLNVCYYDNAIRELGEEWNVGACTRCQCSGDTFNTQTSCYQSTCVTTKCDTSCPSCHQYLVPNGQCCGTCVPTGCHVGSEDNGQCKEIGESWDDQDKCESYSCTMNSEGNPHIIAMSYLCVSPEIPKCHPCEKLEEYTQDCCPKYRCVPNEVCCSSGLPMQTGAKWNPGPCESCYCSNTIDETTGYYKEMCVTKPCPPIDETVCESKGGSVVATEDGCCAKCQIDECFECSRHISSRREHVKVDSCTSLEMMPVAYCDGFCRSGSLLSLAGLNDQCSLCQPSSYETNVIKMKCSDGSKIDYEWKMVTSCGCSTSCECNGPTPTEEPDESEESGSGETPPPPTPTDNTVEEEVSGSGEVPPPPTPTDNTVEEEESGSGEVPPPPTPTDNTVEEEESGSGEVPPPPTPTDNTVEEEESGSGEVPPPPTPTDNTVEEEESGSGEVPPPPTPTDNTVEEEESGSGEVPPPPTPTDNTVEEEESGSGEVPPPPAPTDNTVEEEESGSGEVPPPPTPTDNTVEEEESGSGEVPPPPTPTDNTIEEEESGSGEVPPPPAPTDIVVEEEESGSGSGDIVVEIPQVTTTNKPIPSTTTTTTPAPTTTTSTTIELTTTTIAETTTTTSKAQTEPSKAPTTTIKPTTTSVLTTTTLKTTTEETEAPTTTSTTTEAPETTSKPIPSTTTTTTSTTEEPTTTIKKPVPTTTALPELTTTTEATTEAAAEPVCYWTEWMSSDKPKLPNRNDNESYEHLRLNDFKVCENPEHIECKPVGKTIEDFKQMQEWQVVTCDVETGLFCDGFNQPVHPVCEDYEIRVYCCEGVATTSSSSGGGQWQHQSQSQTGDSGSQSQTQGQTQVGGSQSQGQSQSQSSDEVSEIDSQAQTIIGNIENGQDNQASMPSWPTGEHSTDGQAQVQTQHQTSGQTQHGTGGQVQVQAQQQTSGGQVQTQHSSSVQLQHSSSQASVNSLSDDEIEKLIKQLDKTGSFSLTQDQHQQELDNLMSHIGTEAFEDELEDELNKRLSAEKSAEEKSEKSAEVEKKSLDDELAEEIRELIKA